MTLQKKIFFIVAYALEGVLIALYAWLGIFFLGRLVENEQHAVQESVEWTGRVIARDIRTLDHQLLDWSQWDDMYSFAGAPTEEFVKSNLPTDALDVLGVNFIVIANRDGTVLA
ncbi:MAG: CHASE4 domain-containing protein, partial [Candidatus Moraniibacteriota bacterium]